MGNDLRNDQLNIVGLSSFSGLLWGFRAPWQVSLGIRVGVSQYHSYYGLMVLLELLVSMIHGVPTWRW